MKLEWTLGNKCRVKGSPFRREEPATKGSSSKRGHGQMWAPEDRGGEELADIRKPALFIIIVVCFADAIYL